MSDSSFAELSLPPDRRPRKNPAFADIHSPTYVTARSKSRSELPCDPLRTELARFPQGHFDALEKKRTSATRSEQLEVWLSFCSPNDSGGHGREASRLCQRQNELGKMASSNLLSWRRTDFALPENRGFFKREA